MQSPRSVALIPARSGSKRLQDKNVRPLGGHPMLAYSIQAALDSNVFDAVVCATDSQHYANIATYYGAEVPFLRDGDISGDQSPDIQWVRWVLDRLAADGREFDLFSILRPTSPFRLPNTIQRAWDLFISDAQADSLRAVQLCKQHPGKMWAIEGNRMTPIMPGSIGGVPMHSSQYAALPKIYVQDASLEISKVSNIYDKNSIAGDTILPFVSLGMDGFDINVPEDFILAEHFVETGEATLATISKIPFGAV